MPVRAPDGVRARPDAGVGGKARRLDALTGIRFFAALHVVLYHMHCTAWADLPVWVERLRNHGDSAVALFYVLSGFILTYTHIGASLRVEDPRRFWIARFARIWPLYALGLAACVGFRLYGGGTIRANVASFLASATMLQAWTPDMIFGWNTPGWSISVEAFFYLSFPLLAVPVARLQRVRSLVALIAGAWLLGLALVAWYLHFAPDGRLQHFDSWLYFVGYSPLTRLPEFIIGVALGRIHALRPDWTTVRRADAWALLALAILFGVVLFATTVPSVVVHNTLLAPAFGLLILALARGGRISGWLGAPWLVLLGDASYALYILQEPVLDGWLIWLNEPFGQKHSFAVVAGYIVLLIAVSLAAYRWLEMPVQRWLRKRLLALVSAGPNAKARWPSPRHFGLAGALLAAVILLIHAAPEHATNQMSRVGRALRAIGGVRDVAYDLAGHTTDYLEKTLEAVPDLRIHPYDSARGEKPQFPVVLGIKPGPVRGARYLDGEADTQQAAWVLPAFGLLPQTFSPDPFATVFGARAVRGVMEGGFHRQESEGAKWHRWTDGKARLRIPLDAGERPGYLVMALGGRPKPAHVVVRADGVTLFDGTISGARWQHKWPLPATARAEGLLLELESDVFAPNSEDERKLGVLLEGVRLVR